MCVCVKKKKTGLTLAEAKVSEKTCMGNGLSVQNACLSVCLVSHFIDTLLTA